MTLYGSAEAKRRLEEYVLTHQTPQDPPKLLQLERLIADVIQAARNEVAPF